MKINDGASCVRRATLVDYEIVQQCGSGTYGSVFRAIHKHSRQVVALKKVTKFPMEDGFPVECKYLEKLCASKNVVNMLDYFFSPDGQLVLVFEYMETDLWKLISGPNANVPLLQTKCIMKQLFEGLAQCHAAGIMHRDIKPSNLLINANGVLKLADFGLTTSFVEPPYLSNNVVSLYYRPPELLMGSHSYGPEIDMWSAGCILVELLTNNYLFAGANESDQLDMIFQVFGTPDEDVWPGVTQLPGWGLVESGKQHPLRDLHDNYQFLESNVLDLASSLLQMDPKKRITSYEALHHPWFYATPLPCQPHNLTALWRNNPKMKAKMAAAQQPANNHNRYQEPAQQQNYNIWRKDDSYYPSVSCDGYYIQNYYNNQSGYNYYNNNNYGGNYNNNNFCYNVPPNNFNNQNYYPPQVPHNPYYFPTDSYYPQQVPNYGYGNNYEFSGYNQTGYDNSYYHDGRNGSRKDAYYGDTRRNYYGPRYTHSQL